MKRTIGDFKFSITNQMDLNDILRPQLIIMNLVDKWENRWQAELVCFCDNELEAEVLAIETIEVLRQRDMLVEEEIII